LQSNIYGFDIDNNAIQQCVNNLDKLLDKYGIRKVRWNLLNINSLNKKDVEKFFNYFDFVVW